MNKVHLLIRQAKLNVSLTNALHARLELTANHARTFVSSIDITSTKSLNLIEFNASCELPAIPGELTKIEFTLFITEKSMDTLRKGVGSCIVLFNDHGATKFVYLYDSNSHPEFICTLTFSVFFQDPPIIDVAERNILKLRNSFIGSRRVPNDRELSFLLKRRLNWYHRGPYPASFDYLTEKQLDREMLMLFPRLTGESNQKSRKLKDDRTRTYQSNISKVIKRRESLRSSPKVRTTHMKVGYIGAEWPEFDYFKREKSLYNLYLAEERRLKYLSDKSRNARSLRSKSPQRFPNPTSTLSVFEVCKKKDEEIRRLKRELATKTETSSKIKTNAARKPKDSLNKNKRRTSYEMDTESSRQRSQPTNRSISSRGESNHTSQKSAFPSPIDRPRIGDNAAVISPTENDYKKSVALSLSKNAAPRPRDIRSVIIQPNVLPDEDSSLDTNIFDDDKSRLFVFARRFERTRELLQESNSDSDSSSELEPNEQSVPDTKASVSSYNSSDIKMTAKKLLSDITPPQSSIRSSDPMHINESRLNTSETATPANVNVDLGDKSVSKNNEQMNEQSQSNVANMRENILQKLQASNHSDNSVASEMGDQKYFSLVRPSKDLTGVNINQLSRGSSINTSSTSIQNQLKRSLDSLTSILNRLREESMLSSDSLDENSSVSSFHSDSSDSG